jgi:hypothetical protein
VAAPRSGRWCWRSAGPTAITRACQASSSRRCVVPRNAAASQRLLLRAVRFSPLVSHCALRAEPFLLCTLRFQESEPHTIGRSSGCSTTVDAHFRATSRKHCSLCVSPSGNSVELHEESAQHGVYCRSYVQDHDDLWTRKRKFRLKQGEWHPATLSIVLTITRCGRDSLLDAAALVTWIVPG